MNYRDRLKQIMAKLADGEELTVEEAAPLFSASQATIRRDFQRLHARGEVEKTWGGVRLRGRGFNLMPPFPERQIRQNDAKAAIAAKAASLVRDGDVVMIDGGTTTVHMAAALAGRAVRIVTNSMVIAHEVDRARGRSEGAEVYLAGGHLFPQSELLVGRQARAMIESYHAQWAFISLSGIDASGVTNHEERIVEIERAMMEHAEKIVLVADHSKCGIRSMVHLCHLDEVDLWITDKAPEKGKINKALRKAGVEIVLATD